MSGRPKLPKIGSPPRKMDTHSCTWPRDIARTADAHFVDSGSPLYQVATRPIRKWTPIREVSDHPDLWVPMVSRGHTKRDTWTQVDADGRPYLCVGACIERAKKIPTPQRGVRLTNFVCRLFLSALCKVYDFDTEPKAQKQNCGFNHKIFDFIGFDNQVLYALRL